MTIIKGQIGATNLLPIFFIVASLGLVVFVIFSQTVPVKDEFLKEIYPKPAADASEGVATDRLIVKFKPAVSEDNKRRSYQSVDATVEKKLDNLNIEVLKVEPGTVQEKATKLAKDPKVEFVEPDFKASEAFVPNDQFYPQQWGYAKANFPGGWDRTRGSAGVLVAIVDTGIDGTHPDLAGKIVGRANFTTDPDNPGTGHGTHVAGIAAATTNNVTGVAGAGFDSRLLSVKVLDSTGNGFYSWIAQGIMWSADNGAKVINLSLSGTQPSVALQDAVNYAWSRGAVVVAAAGNDGLSTPVYPASLTNVVAVAATDQSDLKASFSNFGPWVDVAAPGVGIVSSYPTGSLYAIGDGTSMATPFVAGLAALIFANYPTFNNENVVNNILSGADKIAGTPANWTAGRINACNSLECNGPLPTVNPSPTLQPSPSPVFGLTFTPASVNLSLAQNSSAVALNVTSTTSNSFSFIGNPTNFGPGINWNPASSSILVGSSRPVLISALGTVPVGIYSGTGVLQDNQSIQKTFPVTVNVTAAATPSPTPTSTPTPTPTPTPSPTPVPIPGDIDNDRDVDIFDYNILVTNYGKTGANIPGDLDRDGDVDIFDYNIIVTNYGRTS